MVIDIEIPFSHDNNKIADNATSATDDVRQYVCPSSNVWQFGNLEFSHIFGLTCYPKIYTQGGNGMNQQSKVFAIVV